MKKKVIFFDGDGTLWYPSVTKRTKKPWWVYLDETTKGSYLEHLIITPNTVATLNELRNRDIKTIILSTHPDELENAALILDGKVKHFQLEKLFDEVHVTAEYPEAKSQKITEILDRINLAKSDALMVGDSYRWDYEPAMRAGIDSVLINSDYHQENLSKEPVSLIINELDELLYLLDR